MPIPNKQCEHLQFHFTLARPNQINPQSPLLQVNYTLDVQRNRAETSAVLKRAVEEDDYARAREMINAQLTKIRSSVSAADPLCQQLIRDLEYKYSNQYEFKTTMTNMSMSTWTRTCHIFNGCNNQYCLLHDIWSRTISKQTPQINPKTINNSFRL